MHPFPTIAAFLRRIPLRILAGLFAGWAVLAALYLLLERAGAGGEMPRFFPVSILRGPTFHAAGLPWIALFLAVLLFAAIRAERLGPRRMLAAAFLLILLGNLGQGGWEAGFEAPFTAGEIQYYHDAVKIRDGGAWLEAFHDLQPDLLTHSRTHPPFAVLLHHAVLSAGGGAAALGALFTLLAFLALPVCGATLRELEVPEGDRARLLLLFAAFPAVNIYAGASLDGVILLPAALFLHGLVWVGRPGRTAHGFLLTSAAFCVMNLLTFGGVFLLLTAALAGAAELTRRRRPRSLAAGTVALLLFGVTGLALRRLTGYDHILAFRTAAALENPEGFLGLASPLSYLLTRIENAGEILLFLSLGGAAYLLRAGRTAVFPGGTADRGTAFSLAGAGAVLLLFLAGAWRTGETARACLFLYPWLLLLFRRLGAGNLRDCAILAGLQTAAMQLFTGYFW